MSKENQETHPSYALLSFSRTTRGKGTPLFGSSIEHSETIRMEVKPAVIERNLNNDWYFQKGQPYLEVEMSYSQFAEAITAMNIGSGIPVTLRYLNGEQIEDPKFTNKRLQFEEEFAGKMNSLEKKLSTLTEQSKEILNNKKPIKKGDRETILSQIYSLQQEIRANIPFISQQFNEQMDKTVLEAKGEVEAFTQNKITALGMEKLSELKQLGTGETK